MGKVVLGTTISLDGFVNDRNGSVTALYPDLVDWRETEPGFEDLGTELHLERIAVVELPRGRTHLKFRVLK